MIELLYEQGKIYKLSATQDLYIRSYKKLFQACLANYDTNNFIYSSWYKTVEDLNDFTLQHNIKLIF